MEDVFMFHCTTCTWFRTETNSDAGKATQCTCLIYIQFLAIHSSAREASLNIDKAPPSPMPTIPESNHVTIQIDPIQQDPASGVPAVEFKPPDAKTPQSEKADGKSVAGQSRHSSKSKLHSSMVSRWLLNDLE